ncbi:YdcF family protein [Actinokineospora globicatena]|uniref:YdcF family protein n=1 Tax=Actinokineospora globicatena TaxID=103729 RepID=UPI0020A5CC63|nr:YdcF family protein [Actinokineospora globicatena]MCP2306175.1 Uncharacterized SAM-binding protein YcdF, DUF218 family [Actinokineospora globicatena]GLW79948.1 hypothetical protein Aglo01_44290 [Actinokineospora globicatena]GLW86777.1 hypothetical protein Aglo02_44160 [Actinokineospora globicatena]
MGFAVLAVVALGVFGYRVWREPRRLGNAVWLGVAGVLAGLWLVVGLSDDVVIVGFVVVGGVVALVLPAALIANGVLMVRREGRTLGNLLSLLAGLAMVGLGGVTAAVLGFDSSRWLVAAVGSLVFVAGYLAFLFGALLVYSVLYGRIGRDRRADAIIVLGAGLNGSSVPPLLAHRLDRAVQCLQEDAVLVVSGGQGTDEDLSEAEAMARYLRDQGVPDERILVEDKATTTEENLRNSMALLADTPGTVLAVTNNYHVFRTAVLARRLRLPLDVVGAHTAPYFVPSAFLREFVALLAQYRRTNAALIVLLAALPFVLTALAG